MENTSNMVPYNNGSLDWDGLVGLLIIAGIFGGNGFGFGNRSTDTMTNEFVYTNLANQVRDNGTAINNTDRDVLDAKYALDKEIMQNRYDMAMQTNTLQNQANINALNAQAQMSSCCCDLKTAIHSEGEETRALITQNRIEQLQTDLQSAQLTLAQANQTQNILGTIGQWYSKPSVNPYSAYTYGTTIQ